MDVSDSTENNQFGLDLFKLLYEKRKDCNSFLSPLVLGASLVMIYAGATGETRKSIAKALRWGGSKEEAERLNLLQGYLRTLREDCTDHSTLSAGIKILLDKKWECLEDFKAKIKQFELTDVQNCDLLNNSDSVQSTLHSWTATVSHGHITNDQKIKKDNPDPSENMSLISCVYFKGKWVHGFDSKNTQLLPFVVAPGQSEEVPMMCATGRYPYIKDNTLRYSAIELPYQGGRLGLVIILPDEYFGLGVLLQNLTLETVTELLKDLYMADSALNLIVPKFQIKNTLCLSTVLSKLNMEDVFNPDKANFSGMASPSRGLNLSSVTHSAVVEVAEEGHLPTATSSKARPSSNILKVRVDHPFLYVIVDKRSENSFLFIGHMTNPALS